MSPERRLRRNLLFTARLLKAAFKRGHARERRRMRIAAERRRKALNAKRAFLLPLREKVSSRSDDG